MLNAQDIAAVKSTLPLIAATGPRMAAHFYDRMFSHHPELKEIFNLSNQRNGHQREALFNAICAAATHLENLGAILPAVEKIAQKHTTFLVSPAQYAIVGEHLLATIDELFSPGRETLAAWGNVYQTLAQTFINREAEIYQDNAARPGGWLGLRLFRLAKRETQSSLITSFEFTPLDGNLIAGYQPGQYLGIWLKPEGFAHQEIRQYSLTQHANGRSYRIAVKKEPDGLASGWLHDGASIGDVVSLTVPAGDFFMDVSANTPVTLISAGVGQTPMLAMLDELSLRRHQGQVNWLHAAENGTAHAFAAEVAERGGNLPHFFSHVWYRQPLDEDKGRYDSTGLMAIAPLSTQLTDPNMMFYLCGPVAFMQFVARQLLECGIHANRLHYECFGPHKVL